MKNKKLFAALLAAGLFVQGTTTAFAAQLSGTDADQFGPGWVSETDAAASEAWKKVGGVYMDNTGNSINGAILRGISVSKWQGDINWGKVAADDVSFALIRMGSFGYEGEYTMDEYYDKNMREAKANGIHTTPYVYLQTRTVEEAREAARYAVKKAADYEITYPLAVDVESDYIINSLSVQELTDVVNAFCQEVEAAGYTPIIYSDYSKFTTEMDTNQFKYDLWLARYGGSNEFKNRTMWQSTDSGRVDGIQGNVCLEFAFKDYAPSAGNGSHDAGQWKEEGGQWYFYRDGGRITGWINPDGSWYYMDAKNGGAMVAGTMMVIDGVTYTFNGSGVMQ